MPSDYNAWVWTSSLTGNTFFNYANANHPVASYDPVVLRDMDGTGNVATDGIATGDQISFDGGMNFQTITAVSKVTADLIDDGVLIDSSATSGNVELLFQLYVGSTIYLIPGVSLANGVDVSEITNVQMDVGNGRDTQTVFMSELPLGDDIVSGTSGDDTIDSSYAGDVEGERVDNSDSRNFFGEGGLGNSDSIEAGDGNDSVAAGSGADSIDGGAGNDTLDGGADNDSLTGGAGDDTFVLSGGDDTITDFGSGSTNADDGDANNNDFVDLSNYYVDTNQFKADLADNSIADQSDGSDYSSVTALSGSIAGLSALQSQSDSQITEQTGITGSVVCFTPANLIETSAGQIPIGDLHVGDLVQTKDNGYQPILWIYERWISQNHLSKNLSIAPVVILQGSLGNGLPTSHVSVSPGHMLLVEGQQLLSPWGEREALIPAKRMTGLTGVSRRLPPNGVCYIHLLFEQHQIVKVEGSWMESFRPGKMALEMINRTERREIFEIFPELRKSKPENIIPPVRSSFYGKKANRLARRMVQARAESAGFHPIN